MIPLGNGNGDRPGNGLQFCKALIKKPQYPLTTLSKAMQEFFSNVSRYPRYMISLIVGIFWALFERVLPLFKNPVTAVAMVGVSGGLVAFLYFTLKAMLGLTPV